MAKFITLNADKCSPFSKVIVNIDHIVSIEAAAYTMRTGSIECSIVTVTATGSDGENCWHRDVRLPEELRVLIRGAS